MKKTVILLIAAIITSAYPVYAKPVCVETEGEGTVFRGDIPSARMEAIVRSKWAAVEQVAGVDIKSRTVVSDSRLMEDFISTQARGVVTTLQVISEDKGMDTVRVRVKACVEPSDAKDAVSPLALNSSIVVFIASRKLSGNRKDRYESSGSFVEALNNALAERGFLVRDPAESGKYFRPADIERAMNSGNFHSMQSLIYRYKSNCVLIGQIEPVLSTAKGEDVGHGITMPFNKVTVRLIYRLLVRDANGRLKILAAGNNEASGLASNAEDSRNLALKNLAEVSVPSIMDKIKQRMSDLAHTVTVTVEGVTTPDETFAVRDILQQITWVNEIKEEGIGRFSVAYPENSLYLANGLIQKGYAVTRYSDNEIRVRRRDL